MVSKWFLGYCTKSSSTMCHNMPMSERIVRNCPVSGLCGACTQIDTPYSVQLACKQRRIASLFEDLADDDCVMEPIAGMEDPFRFRDKIVSPYAPGRRLKASRAGHGSKAGAPKRGVACGMYAAHSHRIIETTDCLVEHESGRRIVLAVKRIMERYGVEPYNEDAGTGFIRHVVVRVGHESDEVLVTLVTNGRAFPNARNFARELVRRCPEITTVVQNVNTRQTNVILGSEDHAIYGPGFIIDSLCGLSFRISSQSFYQVNAVQTEVLYRIAVNMADLDRLQAPAKGRPLVVLDAYCGTGTIGLVAAASAPAVQVVGIDKVESSIRDARQNAMHNGIDNASFVADDAGSYMRRLAERGDRVDVVLMDPPRSGASDDFLDAVVALAPSRIVYISCNPETQVRDVCRLLDGGYRLTRMQPVDMFPHTDHVECVTVLTKE